ncbi:transposase [Microbacterium caowuchunii]|uniref:Transposase n=1 Tax=Microbacterium caowuchunii TaxID=2614638 RepID=A0A5N0TLA3_9MICO|nr:transposase [Microbacterium caowuchunii]KAA9135218.1 transposase [Microbacterium caowuchunii]
MAADPEARIDEIARELLAVPPSEFVSARKTRAAEESDPDLAAAVRALRKPLLSAWIVNLFGRERPDDLRQALELAARLRAAQAQLDAKELARLGRDRRRLVDALARNAAELAESRGERVSVATFDSVRETLNAAMFDPGAANAVASGRLLRPLEASAAAPADLADAVAGYLDPPEPESADRPASPTRGRTKAGDGKRGEAAEAERAARAEEARNAGEEATRAEDVARDVEERAVAARDHADRLAERVTELEAELSAARQEAERSRAQAEELDAERAEAMERAEAARARAAAAERRAKG